jgi:hypothetical protein
MSDIIESDDFNPKKIYNNLIARCKQAKSYTICCVVEESYIFNGVVPFDMVIRDGMYFCKVIAPSLKEAYVIVANTLPVITFIEYRDEE